MLPRRSKFFLVLNSSMPKQALIMAGFDYQGSRADFVVLARNRQARLLAASPQLTVTIKYVNETLTGAAANAANPPAAAKPTPAPVKKDDL